jgi:hypothetical protein
MVMVALDILAVKSGWITARSLRKRHPANRMIFRPFVNEKSTNKTRRGSLLVPFSVNPSFAEGRKGCFT